MAVAVSRIGLKPSLAILSAETKPLHYIAVKDGENGPEIGAQVITLCGLRRKFTGAVIIITPGYCKCPECEGYENKIEKGMHVVAFA